MKKDCSKKLFFLTITLFVIILGSFVYYENTFAPRVKIDINSNEFPTLGNLSAPINMILLEEPACKGCKEFSLEVFPKVKSKYIDTGKASFTIIPVAFFPGSEKVVEALLCVYYSQDKYNSDAFFEYFKKVFLFQNENDISNLTTDILINLALSLENGDIKRSYLKTCIDTGKYGSEILRNNLYGRKLMKGQLATPTLFINGIQLESSSMDEINNAVAKLKKEGIG